MEYSIVFIQVTDDQHLSGETNEDIEYSIPISFIVTLATFSDKRNANVASARRVAIYILREVTGMSMEEIGREFSGRDHSTIVYSLKTMERDMKNDQHLRETVSDIIKNVKA